MQQQEMLVLAAGTYPDVEMAMMDFENVEQLHDMGLVGKYDEAIVTKESDGKVKIAKTSETGRKHGAWGGAIVGGLLGAVFPPSILVTGAAGAAIGAAGGHLYEGIPRDDLKQIGEMLSPGQAELVVIGEITEKDVDRAMSRAEKHMQKQLKADQKEVDRALKESGSY